MTNPSHSYSQSVSPQTDGTPSKSADNRQIQWVVENISQLKSSHDSLVREINGNKEHLTLTLDHHVELLRSSINQKNELIDVGFKRIEERLDEKNRSLEEKISCNHALLTSKIEATEHKIGKAQSDTRFDTMKWVIGLMVGFPSIAWAIVQIVKVYQK